MQRLILFFLVFFILFAAPCLAGVKVNMVTSEGTIVLELDEEKAPLSVGNFLAYADEGFYNGMIFHRVIKGFMIQGGGFDTSQKKKPTKPPIKNEADNGLKNNRGTIAMARTSVVDSATGQFFINLVNNDFLNFKSPDARGYGYAVFGQVVEGMDVVDKIGATPIKKGVGPFASLPVNTVEIIKVERAGQ